MLFAAISRLQKLEVACELVDGLSKYNEPVYPWDSGKQYMTIHVLW